MLTSRYQAWIIFIIATLSVFTTSFADPPLPTPVARVLWIKGTLKATQPNKEERTLVKTSVIFLHDILTTDDKTQAQIVFTDNTQMTFYPSSKISIDQYAYKVQAKSGSAGKQVTKVIEGGFRTITGVIAKTNNKDYSVETPVATIGVRGTDYAIRYVNGRLYAAWYSGKPCLTPRPEQARKPNQPAAPQTNDTQSGSNNANTNTTTQPNVNTSAITPATSNSQTAAQQTTPAFANQNQNDKPGTPTDIQPAGAQSSTVESQTSTTADNTASSNAAPTNNQNATASAAATAKDKKAEKDKLAPGELCLSKDVPFAQVTGPGELPQPLDTIPDPLKEKLTIRQSSIKPFGSTQKIKYKGKVINSFCIS